MAQAQLAVGQQNPYGARHRVASGRARITVWAITIRVMVGRTTAMGLPGAGLCGPGWPVASQGYARRSWAAGGESSGRNILIIVLVVLALLAAAGFAAFWFTGKPGGGKSSEQTTVSSAEGTDAPGSEEENADAGRDDRDEDANREDDDEDTDDEADSRPKNPNLPGYVTPVNDSARGSNPGGDLNSVWKSGPTSDKLRPRGARCLRELLERRRG